MNFVFKYSKFSLFRRQNDAFSEAVKSSNKNAAVQRKTRQSGSYEREGQKNSKIAGGGGLLNFEKTLLLANNRNMKNYTQIFQKGIYYN